MSTAPVSVGDLIDSSPIGSLQWRTVALCALVAIIDGFDTQAIAFVAPILTDQFDIADAAMGTVFSAALFGLMLGAFGFSALSDRVGRKPVIILSCAIMGSFALLTATATTANEFIAYRFLTGLGLGGAMPNINAITAEMVPVRRRAFLMTLMFIGFPLGAVFGGLASTQLIAAFGWQSVFVMGGLIPLLLCLVLALSLPESFRWLSASKPQDPRLRDFVRTLAGSAEPAFPEPQSTGRSQPGTAERNSVAQLFVDGNTPKTLLLWVVFFSNLLLMYAVLTWLPTIMRNSGQSLDQAILSTVLFNLGGAIGGVLLALAVDRFGAIRMLTHAYLVTAILVAAIGATLGGGLGLTLSLIFFAGMGVIGSQFGLNALTAGSYSTSARATGLGWALAVGRTGSIVGPIVIGVFLLGIPLATLFYYATVPALVCVAALIALAWVVRRSSSGSAVSRSH